jgi:hypothetical protein
MSCMILGKCGAALKVQVNFDPEELGASCIAQPSTDAVADSNSASAPTESKVGPNAAVCSRPSMRARWTMEPGLGLRCRWYKDTE